MMVPLMTMMFIPKIPTVRWPRILSWIPIYTPFTMMNRANAGPPWIDLIGTLILLLATTALALWMSGKIFRIGVLRTGQPPKNCRAVALGCPKSSVNLLLSINSPHDFCGEPRWQPS